MRANDEPPGRYLSIYNFSEWKRSIQSGLRGHFQTRREEDRGPKLECYADKMRVILPKIGWL